MNTVKPYFVHTLLEPITGLAEDDDAVRTYGDLDSNDESQMRRVIREIIVPHELALSMGAKERVKLAYQFYPSKPDADFKRVFYSNLPPFDAPDDPRQFFLWIWDECFSGEDFHLADLGKFIENRDINEPMRF